MRAARDLVVTLVIAGGIAMAIQALVVKPYRIPSESMEPTLDVGQRVLVNRLSEHAGADPHRGDVVVFHPPASAEEGDPRCGAADEGDGTPSPCSTAAGSPAKIAFVKRVVGAPGDRIALRDGYVVRNGRRVDEPYVRYRCGKGSGCEFPRAVTIPPGHWFMLGDNRGNSLDSRYWGAVPRSWIVGNAFATYWPPGRVGPL